MVSNKTISFVAAGGMTFLSLAAFVVLTQPAVKAVPGSHSANASVIVAPTCSMTTTTVTPHTATILNGNRTINIGKTTLEAFCNDSGGFAIYAAGYTGNTYSDNRLVSPNSTSTPDVINAGNTATGNTSSWGVKASVTEGTTYPAVIASDFISAENDGYVEIPDEFALLASRNSVTSKSAGSELDITYGAYVSPSQAAGTYTGQVIYLMVHPANASAPVGIPGAFDTAFADAGKAKLNGYYKMQDMTSTICNAVSEGAEAQLIDTRDNKIYWVLKAMDNKCWMTQNLDHDIVAQENYYTPANTDISANWTPISTAATMSAADMSTGWTYSTTSPQSADTGDWYWNNTWYDSGECIDLRYGSDICIYLNGDQVGKFSQSSSAFSSGTHGHVGNYYNWTAAIAMNDSTGITTGDASSSICPAGWRLPTGGSGGEFAALNAQYGNSTSTDANIITSPLYFVRGGRVNAGFLFSPRLYGRYWFSRVYSSDSAYHLRFDSSRVDSTNLSRNFALSVRCIAR